MELVAIEILLWLGFALLLWALGDGLQQLESEVHRQHFPRPSAHALPRSAMATPQNLIEPMGSYLDQTIYRYAIIEGRHYRFDHVSPAGMRSRLEDTQRWIAPGLVYVEAPVPLTVQDSAGA